MKTIFYAIVKGITESITGLDGDALSLADLLTYRDVCGEVTEIANLVVLIVICLGCYFLADCAVHICNYIERRMTLSK
jgi:hypothetical protein